MRDWWRNLVYQSLKLLTWLILRLGFGLSVVGQQHLPKTGAFLIASNHVSFLDPAVVAAACPRRLVFVARSDLFGVPWLGAFMRFMGVIPVHRNETGLSLRHAVRVLRRGQPVAIFPEGGRQFSGTLGHAQPGVGLLAADAHVPVVPVFLHGTFEAWPPQARMIRPAKIRVAFGPPIRYPVGRLPTSPQSSGAGGSDEAYQALADHVTASWHQLASTLHGRDTRSIPHDAAS